MEKRKLKATRELQRIAALPYNPYFEEDVKRIRRKHAIPPDRKGAMEWFYTDYSLKHGKMAYPLFLPKGEYPFFETGESIADTEVPLERDVVALLWRFRLPEMVFESVLQYVLTGDEIFLDPLVFEPNVECDFDTRKGLPELTVTITGLDPWATKKQWEEIWDCKIRPILERAKDICEDVLNLTEPAKKRPTLGSYRKQMQVYSEWYQLSEIQGFGPTKALEKWEKDHPDQCGHYDPSTITHAIKEFRRIITPIGATTSISVADLHRVLNIPIGEEIPTAPLKELAASLLEKAKREKKLPRRQLQLLRAANMVLAGRGEETEAVFTKDEVKELFPEID